MHFQRISSMEKGQCPTVASWEGGAVRSRKATQTPTTPGQVSVPPLLYNRKHLNGADYAHSIFDIWLCWGTDLIAGKRRTTKGGTTPKYTVGGLDRHRHRGREDYVARN